MISIIALDVDGVLTNGTVMLDEAGRETKALCYRDIDAVFLARREGLRIVLITGEQSPWVDMLANRLQVDRVYQGAKDKRKAIHRLIADEQIHLGDVCYIGDSRRDAEAFADVGFSLAPADAVSQAQQAADRVLKTKGGFGAVAEAVELILELRSDEAKRRGECA